MKRWRVAAAAGVANAGLLSAGAWLVAPARASHASLLVVIAGAGALAFAEAACQSRDDRVQHEPLSLWTAMALLGLLLSSALWSSPGAAPAVGGVLMAAGIALRAAAMRALAADFVSEARPTARLCDSGIYRWLRHPSETGLLCFALGAAVASGALGAWLALGVLVTLSLLRIEREESALCAALGARYRRYAARVPALLPRYRTSDR